jgi:superoxide dismutase, Fe-Mn family
MANTTINNRRNFLKQSSIAAVGLSMLGAEKGLSQLSQQAILKRYAVKPLKPATLTMDGISRKTMEEHFKLYSGYVNKANEILETLATVDYSKANQIYSTLRELKVELSFAVGGVKSHEIYFDILGGRGGKPEGKLIEWIEKNFGSYESWEKDFKATGLAARGWVWLAYDNDQNTLFNYLGDSQNTYPIWNAVPILALDTYEHAYFLDYSVDRKSYIEAFFHNIDWTVVEQRFTQTHN